MTRFATSYLTLGCLHEKKDALLEYSLLINGNQANLERQEMGSLLKILFWISCAREKLFFA